MGGIDEEEEQRTGSRREKEDERENCGNKREETRKEFFCYFFFSPRGKNPESYKHVQESKEDNFYRSECSKYLST